MHFKPNTFSVASFFFAFCFTDFQQFFSCSGVLLTAAFAALNSSVICFHASSFAFSQTTFKRHKVSFSFSFRKKRDVSYTWKCAQRKHTVYNIFSANYSLQTSYSPCLCILNIIITRSARFPTMTYGRFLSIQASVWPMCLWDNIIGNQTSCILAV